MNKDGHSQKTNLLAIPVLIDESPERYHLWIFPGTEKELIQEWQNKQAPISFDPNAFDSFKGLVTWISEDEFRETCAMSNIYCNTFANLSALEIRGKKYILPN